MRKNIAFVTQQTYLLSSVVLMLLTQHQSVLANVTHDKTLGLERSRVIDAQIKGSPAKKIQGGAKRGRNLFHSFRDFSIDKQQSLYFETPVGVTNIIGRVTGTNRSNINGKLGVLGSANLFLLNPNGITFGPTASLDIAGSFFASTGSRILFEDGMSFSAIKPESPSLLTMKVPTGIQLNKNAGSIINQSQHQLPNGGRVVGLNLPPNQVLGLYGGEIILDQGLITVPDGQIELGSLKDEGRVLFRRDRSLFSTEYGRNSKFGDIHLSNLAKIDTSGNQGGKINISAGNLKISGGSQINSTTLGNQSGGGIRLTISDTLELIGTTDQPDIFDPLSAGVGILIPLQSGITTNTVTNSGAAGDIEVRANHIMIKDGAQIASESLGNGPTGDISLVAQESILIDGLAQFPAEQIVDPALITPGLSQEFLIESAAASNISLLTAQNGNSGALTIETKRLSINNGAIITSSPFGNGNGGDIKITATEQILVNGTSPSQTLASLISSTTQGQGAAGDITLRTKDLIIDNGAAISSGTFGGGNGGDIRIHAKNNIVILQDAIFDGRSRGTTITADSLGAGRAGNIRLRSNNLQIQNSGGVSINSDSSKTPGNLTILSQSIVLDNSNISARSTSGQGGNINLTFKDLLLLKNSSTISSTAGTPELPGDGGNIIIWGEGLLLALPDSDSDIQANSFNGQGGMIQLSLNQLSGLEVRDGLTPKNDITAFSENQPELSGIVDLNIVNSDPQSQIVRLPADIGDPSQLIQASCTTGEIAQDSESSLVQVGRGFLNEPNDYRQSPQTSSFWISNDTTSLPTIDAASQSQNPKILTHLPIQRSSVGKNHCSG